MWNLYKNNEPLKPLKFSNNKTQEDIVNETISSINQGHKIIFIHGTCGTGKSAIALNIAKEVGKTSIIVPGKNLQKQYQKDYEDNKYLLKSDKEKLKISVITGRNNHQCKYLQKNSAPKIKREINLKLHDIFEEKIKEKSKDTSADNYQIPCKIELKEKNWNKLKGYIKQNKKIKEKNFLEIKDIRRPSVAGACPYWSPVLPKKYELKTFPKRETYCGLNNTLFTYHRAEEECEFYKQFNTYLRSDVIVFNSLKYKLESSLNRKPLTEAEIIDECDEFLDSFSNTSKINLDRIQNSLMQIFTNKNKQITKEINHIIKQIKNNKQIQESVYTKKIIPIKKTGIYDLLKVFLNSPEFLDDADEESYLFHIGETAKLFEEFFNETFILFSKKDKQLTANIVTTNLAKRFQKMTDQNKTIILMSGTLHNEEILKNIFGIKSYKLIEAETIQNGQIEIKKTGLEINCKYSNFSTNKHTRKEYLNALDRCVETAKKPVIIHVNAFQDLPSEQEITEYNIQNIITREKLKEKQNQDKKGRAIEKFKKGGIKVLFTTRCGRGIDFPGEECNSIIFTKYPNPNVKDAFWKILQQTHPNHYWVFYKDKAKRELLQKVYRGLRFKKDHIYLLSPDSRVLDAFESKNDFLKS